MGRINNAEFLSQVSAALLSNEGKSSVYLTQKRLTASLESPPQSELADLSSNVVDHPEKYPTNTEKYPVLMRFTTGEKKSKISTVVQAGDLDSFWTEYTQALKTGFVGLKKKDKKKLKKSKVSKA